jgi:hypothetical protein
MPLLVSNRPNIISFHPSMIPIISNTVNAPMTSIPTEGQKGAETTITCPSRMTNPLKQENSNLDAILRLIHASTKHRMKKKIDRRPRQKHRMPYLSKCPNTQRPSYLIVPQESHHRNANPSTPDPHDKENCEHIAYTLTASDKAAQPNQHQG